MTEKYHGKFEPRSKRDVVNFPDSFSMPLTLAQGTFLLTFREDGEKNLRIFIDYDWN